MVNIDEVQYCVAQEILSLSHEVSVARSLITLMNGPRLLDGLRSASSALEYVLLSAF